MGFKQQIAIIKTLRKKEQFDEMKHADQNSGQQKKFF